MNLRKFLFSNKSLFSIFSLIFLLAAVLFSHLVQLTKKNQHSQVSAFEAQLLHKESEVLVLLKNIESKLNVGYFPENFSIEQYHAYYEDKGILFLLYNKDSLIFWSGNAVPFPQNYDITVFKNPVYHFGNGWYTIQSLFFGNYRIIALSLIKNDYHYQNEYLRNEFQSDYNISADAEVTLTPTAFPVHSLSGSVIFYLSFTRSASLSESNIFLLFLLYFLSFIFFFLGIYVIFHRRAPFVSRRVLFVALFSIVIILTRFILFYFKIPEELYATKLFSPYYYATSRILPSLGDLFVNISICVVIAYIFFFELPVDTVSRTRSRITKFLLTTLFLGIVTALYELFISLYGGLVLHSSIPLDLTNVYSLNYLSLLSFFILSLTILSFFLFAIRLCELAFKAASNVFIYYSATIICIILYTLYSFLNHSLDWVLVVFILFFLSVFWIMKKRSANLISFPNIFIFLLLFSFISTYFLLYNRIEKEQNERKILGMKLAADRDPLAEFLISDIYKKMQSDSILRIKLIKSQLSENDENRIISYINGKYFGKFWSKYDLDLTLCRSDKMLNVVVPYNSIINCNQYFSQTISSFGQSTLSRQLYYLDYGTEAVNYLAVMPFSTPGRADTAITLYIDITSKYVPRGIGYPELLIDQEMKITPDPGNYSYAIYKSCNLVKNVGKFYYSLDLGSYGYFTDKYVFFDYNHFNHLYYPVNKETDIIISQKKLSFADFVAPFSYFFIFFSIVLAVFLNLTHFPLRLSFHDLNFRTRLQYSMIGISITSFILVGVTSWFFITRQNNSKNTDNLSEKAHSILIEVQQRMSGLQELKPDVGNDLYLLLNKLSLIFFSDINIYDLKGNLIASSRPQIFEESLLSTKMSAIAFNELAWNKKSMFIHNEKIGNYEYLSAYLPFRNEKDVTIGFINLPYFARQNEIRNEVSSFLVAFINIYVLLIVISVLLSLVIGNYVTRPLQFIKGKLSGLKLGKPNEKIDWHRKDEIGELIIEYNKMIDKLSDSADQLARSERESAWREMAKQVAHEIKNPLTPMKLSIQYLQKAWYEKDPGWEQRLDRFSQAIIEQIDSLSAIASEFSDFAKMPEASKSPVDLAEVVHNAAELYKENQAIEIRFDFQQDKGLYVLGDKKQLVRVLINLFKNSIQAFDANLKGVIEISLISEEDKNILSFSDNGSGIPAEQKDKIFSPNFTTKSGGMGMGLAMVKNIIEETGGYIRFESERGRGTTFIITFPAYTN